ncbi:hypothetical protein BSKO_12874 [Bryopsis sp. KO-2023]|nr:hypothetical protein BSKO_12874 [Bryopsis sp. KO-2023]
MGSHGQCNHDHDCGEADCGAAYSLYKHVDLPHVVCLNELEEGCCQKVFKPWSQRTDFSGGSLKSNEDDPELLLHIPFTGSVTLKAFCIIGGPDGTSPSKVRAYINRDDLDFGSMEETAPLQEWSLQEDFRGVLEYPMQVFKFKGVYSLTLHFSENFGGDSSEVFFVGLKGEFSERNREAVEAVYEARALPKDHKVPGSEQGNISRMGM